jgi:putative transposase
MCCVTAPVAACTSRPGCRRRRTGVLGALREVFPATREQRDRVHKTANVSPRCRSPRKRHAQIAAKRFADLHGAKSGKAAAKVIDDLDVLLNFNDDPAEHWGAPTHLEPD